MIQTSITPSAGKRLIARSIVCHPAIREALTSGTIVVVAGTTNGYVAESCLLHAEMKWVFPQTFLSRHNTPALSEDY
jgi:hypothetical protein